MQRRPGTSAASSASSASSAPNGAHNGTQRPSLERTSSKTVRPQNKMVVFMTIVLPLLFVSLVLYLTGILSSEQHQHQQRHDEDADAVGRAPRKADNTRLKKGRSTTSKTKEDAASALDTVSTTSGGVEYHIVFSTGCSLYQDWQSYVFFFQAAAAQQPGTVTRIVSGCDAEEEQKMTDLFQDQIHPMAPGRFKIHFTPDFSKLPNGKSFVYWNKPYGMRHWLENAQGFPNNPVNEDAIVILLDPDQLIMRPFTENDFSNTVWKFIPKDKTPYTRIEHGKPMGQYYGFALQWLDKVNATALDPHSPILSLSRNEARAGYIVGPPYIATARDMYTIVKQWSDFAKPVYEEYPYLLAEMFAYCLGAAHKQLPHQTAASFMISDISTGNMEGWSYIDALPEKEVCGGFSVEELPNVLHFCQRYGLGKYFFGKRKLPKDFLSCKSPLLAEPPHDVMDRYEAAVFPGNNLKEWKPVDKKRNAFVICYILPALNAAATYYKQQHCDQQTANYDKSLIFFKSLDMTDMK